MSKVRRSVIVAWAAGCGLLNRGTHGDAVVTLQRLLGLFGFEPGPDDGIFGPRTESALVDCQRELTLAADGVCGPISAARLSFAHAVDWARSEYLPIREGGPLGQGKHPIRGYIPASRGKCSTFGGPADAGDRGYGQALVPVRPASNAKALYDQHPLLVDMGIFRGDAVDPLPEVTCCGKSMQAGISWLLDPDSYYCAMRWHSGQGRPKPESNRVMLVAENGRCCVVAPTDWGPARWTGRAIDISPGAESALGVKTDSVLTIAWAEDGAPIGPVK